MKPLAALLNNTSAFLPNQSSIQRPSNTPMVRYEPKKNVLLIKGDCTSEYAPYIFESVLETLGNHFEHSEDLNLYLHINDLNTNTLTSIFEIFKLLQTQRREGKKIKITWFFNLNDQALMDNAYDFSDLFQLKFVVVAV